MMTLRRQAEFDNIHKHGKPVFLGFARVVILPSSIGKCRYAIVTPKRLGNAVVRNRIRRRLRSALFLAGKGISLDILIFPNIKAKNALYFDIQRAFTRLLAS